MESSRSTSPCSSRETMSSSSERAASKLNCSMAGAFSVFSAMDTLCSGSHEGAQMCSCGARRRVKVIAALEGRNNAAVAVARRNGADRFGRPGKIIFLQPQLRQRVGAVGIKTGRDHHEIGPECRQCRQQTGFESIAELHSGCSRRKRQIDNVMGDSSFAGTPGSGIKRPLMGGCVKQVPIG